MKKLSLMFLLLASVLFGCKKVMELNNYGVVESFGIVLGSLSSGVELSDPSSVIITQDDKNYIYINVHKGKHVTPVAFEAKIGINTEAEKILNIKPKSSGVDSVYLFSFDETSEPIKFYVIAQSGKAVEWEARLRFSDLSDAAEIDSFGIANSPSSVVLTQFPIPNTISKDVDVYVVKGVPPFTLFPKIVISENSTINYNGTGLKFNDMITPYNVKVTSQSGFVNNWNINLKKTEEFVSDGAESKEMLSRMALNRYSISPSINEGSKPIPFSIDSTAAKVYLYLSSSDVLSGNLIDLGINPIMGSDYAGSNTMSFSQSGQEKPIYMIDKQSAKYRRWNVVSTLLSDKTIIVSGVEFGSYSSSGGAIINSQSHIDNENKLIWFNINTDEEVVNVTLRNVVCLVNSGATSDLGSTLTFRTTADVIPFTIKSPDGSVTENWSIKLRGGKVNTEVELVDFDLGSSSVDWTKIYIEQSKKRITVAANQMEGLNFTPKFTLSKGAVIVSKGGTLFNGASSSATIDTPIEFSVMAEDGVNKSEWVIEFIYAPQFENRRFDDGLKTWGTANVTAPIKVLGTEMIDRGDENGPAVQCTTIKQDALLFGYMVAAATAYKGVFQLQFSLTGLQHPRMMTKFGIPFSITRKPISVTMDSKYIPGNQMQQAVYKNNKFVIEDRQGTDASYIFIELLNYTANGGDISRVPYSYSGEGKNGMGQDAEGVKLISRSELVMEGTDTKYQNWVNDQTVSFNEYAGNKNETVTHIAVVVASSKAGDVYLGAIGSRVWADNIIINYYQPEVNAVVKIRK